MILDTAGKSWFF